MSQARGKRQECRMSTTYRESGTSLRSGMYDEEYIIANCLQRSLNSVIAQSVLKKVLEMDDIVTIRIELHIASGVYKIGRCSSSNISPKVGKTSMTSLVSLIC